MSIDLEDLARGLGDLLRDIRPIALRVASDPVQLPSSQAVSVGPIVNESATNAFKVRISAAATPCDRPSVRRCTEGVGHLGAPLPHRQRRAGGRVALCLVLEFSIQLGAHN